MLKSIRYMDPAGNLTAIVTEACPTEKRIELSREIMATGKAEQVGFVVEPRQGSFGRLEMMGGEFCGNATRAFAYMKAKDELTTGQHALQIEISGVSQPVTVEVDLEAGEAYTHMPIPIGQRTITVDGCSYVCVHMEGIDHIMVKDVNPDEVLVKQILNAMHEAMSDACGIMFLKKTEINDLYQLTPAVYVKATDSLVWESSCGSGSVAAAWYFSMIEDQEASELKITFREPGGEIEVDLYKKDNTVTDCIMGGKVSEII